jgi:RND family efflux transporter MFP subunit
MLGYLAPSAPFDGVVAAKRVDVGDQAAPGRPLIELEQPAGKRFEAAVPESLLGHVSIGSELELRLAGTDRSLPVRTAEIEPAGDQASRTWRVKFDLPDGLEVLSGSFGRIQVPRDQSSVLTVPATAVLRRGQLDQVFVIEDGHASLRLVKIGRATGDQVEILSGLDDGETLVRSAPRELKDGQPVNVR